MKTALTLTCWFGSLGIALGQGAPILRGDLSIETNLAESEHAMRARKRRNPCFHELTRDASGDPFVVRWR